MEDINGTSVKIRGSVPKVSDLDNLEDVDINDAYIIKVDEDLHLFVFDGVDFIDAGVLRGPQQSVELTKAKKLIKEYKKQMEGNGMNTDKSKTNDNVVSDMEQIFNFIKENDLKDVQFQYNQKKGIAFVRGTKDGYSYAVKLDFRGESHE